jgi:hypothetical protein
MHAQRSSSPEQVDAAVMGLLLDARFDLWAVSEVESEIGSAVAVADSLMRLQAVGLVHLIEETFVKASRAALYFNRLEAL